MAKPFMPSYASAHQPSSTEQLSAPFKKRLLARGAAGFLGPSRVVEPDVDTLHQVPRHVHVVVFDEHDAMGKLGPAAHLDDVLDQLLAELVFRVSLAGEDELHGPIRRR